MSYTKAIITGNLCRDPELKFLPAGTSLASFTVGVNRKWTDSVGQSKEEASFIDCTAFGKTAENINKFFRKGNPIFIDGRLKTESWTTKAGDKRSKLVVIVEQFQFMGRVENREDRPKDKNQSWNSKPETPVQPAAQESGSPIDRGDVPF